MSRKDYELIAAVLRNRQERWADHYRASGDPALLAKYAEVGDVAEALAEAFAADNPRFDYDRFVVASAAIVGPLN